MGGFDYEDLLDRARERIPEGISQRSRWTMPEPEILIEGSQTILRNFSDVVDATVSYTHLTLPTKRIV